MFSSISPKGWSTIGSGPSSTARGLTSCCFQPLLATRAKAATRLRAHTATSAAANLLLRTFFLGMLVGTCC